MKSPLTLAIVLLLGLSAVAQFNIPVKLSNSNGLRNDIQKVVETFPHQFSSIRGEILNKNPQTVEYASLVKPSGAQETMIVQYSASLKPIYSWQSVLLTTEDYEEAEKKYKAVFTQLKGMNVKYVADLYTLRGPYEEPDESRKFTTSILTPANPPLALKKLKVEVSMQFEFPEWKIAILVYEKEREDDEQVTESE